MDSIDKDRHRIVTNAAHENIGNDHSNKTGKNRNIKIGKTLSQQVGGSVQQKAGQDWLEQVGVDLSLKAATSLVLDAGMSITLKAGSGTVVLNPAGVSISGSQVRINSGGGAGSAESASPTAPKSARAVDPGKPGSALNVTGGNQRFKQQPVEFDASKGKQVDEAAFKKLDKTYKRTVIGNHQNSGNIVRADTEASGSTALRQTGGGYVDPADKIYDAIRASETDVGSIAANTGIKPQNIQKVKDHVFYNEHLLDRYVHLGEPAVVARFDSNSAQAKAWKRLEAGTHTDADITWLKHETGERWYEMKYNSGYTEAHDRVDWRWSGNPWEVYQ